VIAVGSALAALLRTRPRGRGGRVRVLPSLALLTGGAAIAFASWVAYDGRCGHGCDSHPREETGFAGFHRWWHRHDSWQWGAQLTLAAVALALAATAFALTARAHPRARIALWAARAAYAVWIVLVFAVPAACEVVMR
jgi:hypothetical protein